MTFSEHCKITAIRKNTTAIRKQGITYRLYNGELIAEKHFLEMFKLPVRCNICNENPDPKNLFLNA